MTVEITQREDPNKTKQGQQSRRDQKRHIRGNTRDKRKKVGEGKEGIGQEQGEEEEEEEDKEEEEEEDPFRSIEEKTQPVKKKVPLLTIYISKSPLLEFARLYG